MTDASDIFSDTLDLFTTDDPLTASPSEVHYGPIQSKIPDHEGKAFMVLASQIFNSGLVMAEMMELGRIKPAGTRILELGASTSLPTLLASSFDSPPDSILTTDYPDAILIKNLQGNLQRNAHLAKCPITAQGYKWGDDVEPLLATLPDPTKGFTLLILSDTLWLHDEHTNLLRTISNTLSRTEPGYVYFTTGHYAKRPIVEEFFHRIETEVEMEYEEMTYGDKWEGEMPVDIGVGPERHYLDVRKAAVWCFRAWRRGLKPTL
ncbi:hypothetical protein NliqN6_4029 [Naganishia liquefaciens]|uniref:Uncharacterized protein n=1 Tax=Naganishia liquefaciens TaxID=104408 RepID=A0A8H3YGW7_9TREE|nr:hypothetical protein NliqN6_4029 [Naganishia liquefaciens]